MRRLILLAVLTVAAAACASAGPRGPMQRALDASLERVQRTETYIQAVSGITGDASRLARGDGFVYLADVAPTLRHLGLTGDTASYRKLRQFVQASMMARDSAGAQPRRRFRVQAPFEPASPYAVRRLGDALALGWQAFGDTASAALAASLRSGEVPALTGTPSDLLVQQCMAADATVRTDPGVARTLLASAKGFGSAAPSAQESQLDLRGIDGELVALACLTRMGLAVRDPDATVRFLDRLLDRLSPFLRGSGRPDPGAAAELLLALREVRLAGPHHALP